MDRRTFLSLLSLTGCKCELEDMNIAKLDWWSGGGVGVPTPEEDNTDNPYSSYTPSWTGFSADPTVVARYYNHGGMVHLWITPTVNGTSNATGFTVSLPVQAAAYSQYSIVQRVVNGGVSQSSKGLFYINSASPTIATIYLTPNLGTFGNINGKAAILHVVYEASGYTNYTPSFAGFSADPTVVARYKITDTDLCHFYITTTSNGISNTSAADSTTVSLPFTSADFDQYLSVAQTVNNGSAASNAGLLHIPANSSTGVVYRLPTMSTTWTASGNKGFHISGIYKIA